MEDIACRNGVPFADLPARLARASSHADYRAQLKREIQRQTARRDVCAYFNLAASSIVRRAEEDRDRRH
jgi:hypothetical protein